MRFVAVLAILFFVTAPAWAEFKLQDDLLIMGGCNVTKNLVINEEMTVTGTATFVSDTVLEGTLNVRLISYDTAIASVDSMTVNGMLEVEGNTRLGDTSSYVNVSEDGVMTFVGDARPIKYKWLPHTGIKAYTGIAPAYAPAWGAGGTWQYTDGALTALQFVLDIPEDVDDTEEVYVGMVWSCNTQSKVGNFYLKYSVIGVDEDATATQQIRQGYKKSSGTANGVVISYITIDTVSYDTNDTYIACTLYRDSTIAEDTLNDTAELYGVKLKYTANKCGEEI